MVLCGCRTIPTRVGRTVLRRRVILNRPDHPHAGGENGRHGLHGRVGNGPSPRGWGEPILRPSGADAGRTIPTRVGRTWRAAEASRARSDHPHAGGENAPPALYFRGCFGPSPRGWGEQSNDCPPPLNWRTIPTRVGRTSSPISRRSRRPDHPHAGGENARATAGPATIAGPSPRGWGEQRVSWSFALLRRTIPTRVGRTREKTSTQG